MTTGNPQYETEGTGGDRAVFPPCWCNNHKAKYGCREHGPQPLEPQDMAECMYCTYGTKNIRPPACDPCVGRLEHAAAELNIPEIHGLLNQFDWFGDVA